MPLGKYTRADLSWLEPVSLFTKGVIFMVPVKIPPVISSLGAVADLVIFMVKRG